MDITGDNLEENGAAVDAGEYKVEPAVYNAVVYDAHGEIVDSKYYEISTHSGELTIAKRQVTLTSATDSKVYDGTALANSAVTVGGDGFVGDEGRPTT